MNAISRFLHVVWRGLDGLRKVLHLLLLLVLFGFVFGALRTSIPHLPQKAALVIAPEGRIVDQLSGDAIERAIREAQGQGQPETLLWDLTRAIRAAAKDSRIGAIVIDTDEFEGAGQPTLEEVARALAEFRATGKKVVARGTAFMKPQYYLAAQADEIYLDSLGFVLVDGYGRYQMFFKDALDKLGVDVNVFRAGKFKSAAEIFMRTDMSPEEREQSLAYLNVLWAQYQKSVTGARRLRPDALATYVDTLAPTVAAAGGNAASVAVKAGLVTAVKSRVDVEARVIALVGEDEETGSFNAVPLADYVRVVRAGEKLHGDGRPRVGVIVAAGEMQDGSQPPGTIGDKSLGKVIRQARLDDDVKAVVLRVNSPGGSALAAEDIHRELLALKAAGKPLIVSMGDVAASGGYYIAAPADEIWASPATVTGSIGVFAIIPTIDRTLGKVGISVDGVATTDLAGQLRIDRPLSEDARTLLQATVDRTYSVFLDRVSTGRHKPADAVNDIGQGRVWAGADALRIGLVDHLGGFDDAVKAAAKRAKLTDYELEFLEPELSWAEELAQRVRAQTVRLAVGSDARLRSLAGLAQLVDPVQREAARLQRFVSAPRPYVYCFCIAP